MSLSKSKSNFYRQSHDRYQYINQCGDASEILMATEPGYSDDKIIIDRFVAHIKSHTDKDKINILDAGCGPGARISEHLTDKYPEISLNLFDAEEKVVEHLKPTYGENVIQQCLGDVLIYEDDTFDAIVCNYVVQHLKKEQLAVAINEFQRILKPGGIGLIIFKYGYENLTIYDKYYDEYRQFRLYTHGDLEQYLQDNCQTVKIIGKDNKDFYFSDLRPVVNSLWSFQKKE